jgi:hypothetical protein
MKLFKNFRFFPLLVLCFLIEYVIIPVRMYVFTQADENEYDYTEKYSNQKQVKVTNNLGRAAVYGEFVYLGGYFGFVSDFNGIANGAAGYINIDSDREVESKQVEPTDTFTIGSALYFLAGGAGAAGTFVDSAAGSAIAVGTITGEQGAGGAQTAVQFRPYLQKVDNSGLDARLSALEVNAASAQKTIFVPLAAITQEDGTPLAKLASTASGFSQIGNKELVISLPINATIEALGFSVPVPQDLDNSANVTVHVLAGKDANLDALTLDCEVYPCAAGDVQNADIQDTAAQTIVAAGTELIFTCGADGVLAAPGVLSVVLTLGGTNDGDAVYIYGAWIEYTSKVMTS